jgi:hypothetical protein
MWAKTKKHLKSGEGIYGHELKLNVPSSPRDNADVAEARGALWAPNDPINTQIQVVAA